MHIERIVTICLEAIEQGATVETCLARYPAHAAELAPLLQLALSLCEHPKPRMSDQAFRAGRMAVAAAARAAQSSQLSQTPLDISHANRKFTNGAGENGEVGYDSLHNGPLNGNADRHSRFNGHTISDGQVVAGGIEESNSGAADRIGHRRLGGRRTLAARARATAFAQRHGDQRKNARSMARPQRRVQPLLVTFVLLLLVIGGATMLRQSAGSLPGTALYEIKTAGQQVQGVLMRAAGEGAMWHARQATLQIAELEQYESQNAAAAATVAQIEEHVQQALAAAALFSVDQQQQFYATWLEDLARMESDLQQATDVNPITHALLAQTVAQITAADADTMIQIIPDFATPNSAILESVNAESEQSADGEPENGAAEEGNSPLLETATTVPTTDPTPVTGIGTTEPAVTATDDVTTSEVVPTTLEESRRATDSATTANDSVAPASAPGATPTRLLRATPLPPTPTIATQNLPPLFTSPPGSSPGSITRPPATTTPLPVITRVMPLQSVDETPKDDAGVDENREEEEEDGDVEDQTQNDEAADERIEDRDDGAESQDNPAGALPNDSDAPGQSTDADAPTGTVVMTPGNEGTVVPDGTAEFTPSPAVEPSAETATFVPTQPTEPVVPVMMGTPNVLTPEEETPESQISTPAATTAPARRTLQATPDIPDEATPVATEPAEPGEADVPQEPAPLETEEPPPATADTTSTSNERATATPHPAATKEQAPEPVPTEGEIRPRRTRRPPNSETPVAPNEAAADIE